MATDIIIPSDLWDGDEECVITAWLASDNAQVTEGALIAEIMTAKVQYEILAPASGTLNITKAQNEIAAKGDAIGVVS